MFLPSIKEYQYKYGLDQLANVIYQYYKSEFGISLCTLE